MQLIALIDNSKFNMITNVHRYLIENKPGKSVYKVISYSAKRYFLKKLKMIVHLVN